MNDSSFDVFAIGNAIIDVIADTDDAFLTRHEIAKGSMQLVDAQTSHDLYDKIGPAVEISGGSAANVIAGVASLGGATGFAGRVGDDALGEIFLHDLHAQGIHAALHIDADERTGHCLVLVTPDAQRSMRTYLGATAKLAAEDLDTDSMRQAKIILIEGYVWTSAQGRDILVASVAAARDCGARVALSLPNPDAIAAGRDELLARLDDSIDILFGNEEEMLALYGSDDFAQAVAAARGNDYLAALTRSEKGATLVQGDVMLEVPAQRVEPVDSTGAGDLYAAGLLYGLARGWSLERSGTLASRTAAHIIEQYGGRSRTPLAPLKEKV